MIKCFIQDDKTEWDLNLASLAAAYRSSVHETTEMSPNLMMLGREVRLPVDVIYNIKDPVTDAMFSVGEYVNKLRDKLQKAHVLARKKINTSVERQKHYYDLHTKEMSYEVGEKVLYLQESQGKLDRLYSGPWIITEKFSPYNYKIRSTLSDADGGKCPAEKVVHHDKLKKFLSR